MASEKNVADSMSLFQICRAEYPEPVARVAGEALFWSQYAVHKFKGRKAFYKEDRDLAEAIGKHPKTVGRLLLKTCTSDKSPRDAALFKVAYGPKPGAYGGRVRWLRQAANWSMQGCPDHMIEMKLGIKPDVHAAWKLRPEWIKEAKNFKAESDVDLQ